MKILHIDSSVRVQGSYTRELTQMAINELGSIRPIEITYIDIATNPYPHIKQDFVEAMYTLPTDYSDDMKDALQRSDKLIEIVDSHDLIIMGVPMYNFGIPSTVKSFFDHLVRSGTTFEYSDNMFKGLLQEKKVLTIIGSGGSYQSDEHKHMDFVTNYLRNIWKFVGVEDQEFVHIQPSYFYGPDAAEIASLDAKRKLKKVIKKRYTVDI